MQTTIPSDILPQTLKCYTHSEYVEAVVTVLEGVLQPLEANLPKVWVYDKTESCFYCNFVAADSSNISQHLRRHHTQETEVSQAAKIFIGTYQTPR